MLLQDPASSEKPVDCPVHRASMLLGRGYHPAGKAGHFVEGKWAMSAFQNSIKVYLCKLDLTRYDGDVDWDLHIALLRLLSKFYQVLTCL